ncbi:MAG: YqgE/AlgH family protein [Pseudomonadota bacterium]
MTDPRFTRTVLLIIDHSDTGTRALVLNRPARLRIGTALPEIKDTIWAEDLIHIGGPVNPMAIHVLARPTPETDDQQIIDGVVVIPDFTSLNTRIQNPNDGDVRFFAGYAGWADGQLRAELGSGAWILAPATPGDVFAQDPGQWERLVEQNSGQWVGTSHGVNVNAVTLLNDRTNSGVFCPYNESG